MKIAAALLAGAFIIWCWRLGRAAGDHLRRLVDCGMVR